MQTYDYARRTGIRELSWDQCAELAQRIAEQLHDNEVELIIGVARAGLIPAVEIAMAVQVEFFPVRLSRRVAAEVRFPRPVWRTPIPAEVSGRRIAVVDEIADSGESVELARRAALEAGASAVVTACLVSHSWADPRPDVVALTSDELIVFPWGLQVYQHGVWRPDPELEEALRHQPEASATPDG